jgi:vancomycin resistance protein YoaR
MGKQTIIHYVLLLAILFGLAACQDKPAKEGGAHKETVKTENQKENKEQEQKAPKEKVVNVIDPNTKAVIRTIHPEEIGYGSDDEKYKQELTNWAKEIARGTETKPGYDQRNIPDRLDESGQIIKGKPRIILEEEELVNRIIKASAKGGDVELPLSVQPSGYREDEAPFLDEVVVASYTTKFNPNDAGRNKNIELSAAAINNVIVGVNDYFSFNTTVGPSDEAHGYQPALEAVNGKLVMGIGGGICQTSTTLFNAVDQIGVTYVERHHHSVSVGYVPPGRDATVSYKGVDFRFQNTSGAPFLIKTIYGNGTLTVEIRTSAQYAGTVKRAV